MDKVHNDNQNNHHKHKAQTKGGKTRRHLGTLRTVDNEFSDQGAAVKHGSVEMAGIINGDVQAVQYVFNDFTESEGNDRQIVSAQTENRDADEETGNGSEQAADDDSDSHQQNRIADIVAKEGNGDNAGESTHAHKACVSQAELTENTDGQVQGQRHDDVDTDGDQLTAEAAAEDAVIV